MKLREYLLCSFRNYKTFDSVRKENSLFLHIQFKKMPIHERSSVFKDIRLQKVQNYREKHISKGAHIHFRKERQQTQFKFTQ